MGTLLQIIEFMMEKYANPPSYGAAKAGSNPIYKILR